MNLDAPTHRQAARTALIVLLCFAAADILLVAGCRTRAQSDPAPQTSTAPAQATDEHLDAAGKAAEAVGPFVSPPGKPYLETTVTEITSAKATNKEQIIQIEATNGQTKALANDLRTEKEGRIQDGIQAQAKFDKEHAAYKWLGWRTMAIIAWTLGSIAGLAILAIVTGVAGTMFPVIWPIAGVLFRSLKSVIGLVTLGAGRLAPAIQGFDNWFDKHVEQWRAGKAIAAPPAGAAKP